MDWLILVLSLVAGVVGTGFGGLIGALLKNRGARVMGRVLGFAGGVMIGVVAFEMIPEAISSTVCIGKAGGIATAVATTVGGMAVVFAVNKLLDFIEHKKGNADVYRANAVVQAHALHGSVETSEAARAAVLSANATAINENTDFTKNSKKSSLSSQNKNINTAFSNNSTEKRRRELIKAGTVMLIAIALHNFPEGMAIGASGTLETQMGVLIALIIALHNIPEGMAISAPLVSGGVHGGKAILLTALAGGATVIGAVFGLAVGGLGELATGICLSLASGAMLYVTFCDILPQSISLNSGEVPSISMLAGLIFSIIFVFAF
ncbi:MAG: ZIP family metal transporter [Clostridia bacterium]|nr:ZIP family metal transporter [Clostridia bacterium]